jgi:amino acid transporter
VSLVTYTIIGFGLYLYSKNKVGPRFWAIVAGVGAALGCLIALMLVLIIATIYAGSLWARGSQ